MSFERHPPIERHYRDFKYFNRTKFKNNLKENLNEGVCNCESFKTTFTEVLNKHAPLRKKFYRDNHASYIIKTLKKAIIRSLSFRQNFSKLKPKPTSNYTKSIKTFVVIYTKGEEENNMSP